MPRHPEIRRVSGDEVSTEQWAELEAAHNRGRPVKFRDKWRLDINLVTHMGDQGVTGTLTLRETNGPGWLMAAANE